MQPNDFIRIVNNFYNSKGLESDITRISLDAELVNYFNSHQDDIKQKFRVAFVFICLNPLYWQFAPEMVNGARQFFLPGHKTDFFFWTDIPENQYEIYHRISSAWQERGKNISEPATANLIQGIATSVADLRKRIKDA